VAPQFAPTWVIQLGANTSRGAAKVLTQESALPVGSNAPEFVPHPIFPKLRPVQDTSRGMPEGLRPELALPIGESAPFLVADVVRPVTDTSRGSDMAAYVVPPPSLPPGNAEFVAVTPFAWSVVDTGQSAFALITPPGVVVVPPLAPQAGVKHHPGRRKVVVEIDGERFVVRDVGEAVELLRLARETALETAPAVAVKSVASDKKKGKTPAIRIPVVRVVSADGRDEVTAQIAAEVNAARAQIAEIYRQAAIASIAKAEEAEADSVAMLMIADDEDDEALIKLLLERYGRIGRAGRTKGG
jgi:hypothetical protein